MVPTPISQFDLMCNIYIIYLVVAFAVVVVVVDIVAVDIVVVDVKIFRPFEHADILTTNSCCKVDRLPLLTCGCELHWNFIVYSEIE
jgi:hypothetical protein